jgi:hypothetical protein
MTRINITASEPSQTPQQNQQPVQQNEQQDGQTNKDKPAQQK